MLQLYELIVVRWLNNDAAPQLNCASLTAIGSSIAAGAVVTVFVLLGQDPPHNLDNIAASLEATAGTDEAKEANEAAVRMSKAVGGNAKQQIKGRLSQLRSSMSSNTDSAEPSAVPRGIASMASVTESDEEPNADVVQV